MRIAQTLLAWFARRRPHARHALLLPIQSTVAARHLLPVARLAHELGIAVYYTLSTRVARGADVTSIRGAFAGCATPIATPAAHATRWALIVVADHGHFRPLLHTGSPVVHIGHGNPSKTDPERSDLPWEYGHAPRTRAGVIAYREMIESSDLVRDALVDADPALAQRIRVLGRLLDDEMLLQHRKGQVACLRQLGLHPERPVLLAASTLRANSLFGRWWDALLPQLRELAASYQVVLCPHPREYATWSTLLGSDPDLRLLPAGASTEQALTVAQVLVSDFSSVCQKAALLGVPMVLANCDPLPVWSQGATRLLYAHWPVWNGGSDLAARIAAAERMRGEPAASAIADWVNSRPGQARILYAAWLRDYFPQAGRERALTRDPIEVQP